MPELFRLHPAESPVMVNVPHAGTALPEDLVHRLSEEAAGLPDTDWYVDELYDFAAGLGAGLMVATYSRYVVDLNRGADDAPLYTRRTTGLVPNETFDGAPLYRPGQGPDAGEAALRVRHYWKPYHQALESELERIRAQHGFAILLDGHSIKSRVPALFAGRLPDLNLGTHGGRSADPGLADAAWSALPGRPDYRRVRDGRFKGGFNTRHYGRPERSMHALQLEMAQCCYMDEATLQRRPDAMRRLRDRLSHWVHGLIEWRPS